MYSNQKILHRYQISLFMKIRTLFISDIHLGTSKSQPDKLLEVLKKYNMLNNKHIPSHFKCNSRNIRLKLLAGLVDTDGYVNYNTIEIAQKSKQMTDDILYLALSIGFAAYSRKKKTTWTYKKYGICNIIKISP